MSRIRFSPSSSRRSGSLRGEETEEVEAPALFRALAEAEAHAQDEAPREARQEERSEDLAEDLAEESRNFESPQSPLRGLIEGGLKALSEDSLETRHPVLSPGPPVDELDLSAAEAIAQKLLKHQDDAERDRFLRLAATALGTKNRRRAGREVAAFLSEIEALSALSRDDRRERLKASESELQTLLNLHGADLDILSPIGLDLKARMEAQLALLRCLDADA